MATTLEQLKIKSADDTRSDFLRVYRNELINRGVANPIVSEGTEIHAHATALSQQIYVVAANVPLAANAQMPDSALGDDLKRVAAIYRLSLRPAGPSTGGIVLRTTLGDGVNVGIAAGLQLIDESGQTYTVSTGGAYAQGASAIPVPIRASGTGASTNLAAGKTLRWTAPPPFVQTTCLVATGGLTGGVDAETIEGLRERLLDNIANPPNGVNWPSAVKAAEDTTTAVQKGFAYPAANGPSTLHIAVTRAPTASNKGRNVDSTVMTSTVVPGVLAWGSEFFEIVTTTVANVAVDVSIGLSIPSAPTASSPGPGGGWLDANPFPVNAGTGYCAITNVASTTIVTVASDTPPAVGDSVCWLSTDDWTLRTAKIVSFTGAGPYVITLDTPLVSTNGVSVAVGDWLSPAAVNSAAYYAAALAAFATMGPGEKTNLVSLLPRALRHPYLTASWPSELKSWFLRKIELSGDEVTDTSYLYRSQTTPAVCAAITDAPNVFTPRQIGFYPIA